MRLLQFDSLPSTHQYCELLNLPQEEEFTIVWASEQTAGIGQRGNHWESHPGENITMSMILHPTLLPIADQNMLTKVLSLALYDLLTPMLPQQIVQIKWPNDIYVDGHKICGILVSHQIAGNLLRSSICSVGLNVNQTTFSNWIPNPTSLALLTGRCYSLEPLIRDLARSIEKRYQQLNEHHWKILDEEYLAHLLNYHQESVYQYQGAQIRATIQGVNRFGHLQLTTADGDALSCEMKEIQFLPSPAPTAL